MTISDSGAGAPSVFFQTQIRVLEPDRALCEVAEIPVDKLYSNSRTDAESAQLAGTLTRRLKVEPNEIQVNKELVYLGPTASQRLATYAAATATSHFLNSAGSGAPVNQVLGSVLFSTLTQKDTDLKALGETLCSKYPAEYGAGCEAMTTAWGVDSSAPLSMYFSRDPNQQPLLAVNQSQTQDPSGWLPGTVNPSGITTVQAQFDCIGNLTVANLPDGKEPVALQASLEAQDGRRTYKSSDEKLQISVPADAFPSRKAIWRATAAAELGFNETLEDTKGNLFQMVSVPFDSPLSRADFDKVVAQLGETERHHEDVKDTSQDGVFSVTYKDTKADGLVAYAKLISAGTQQVNLNCLTRDPEVAQKYFDSAKLR